MKMEDAKSMKIVLKVCFIWLSPALSGSLLLYIYTYMYITHTYIPMYMKINVWKAVEGEFVDMQEIFQNRLTGEYFCVVLKTTGRSNES